jgi:hypothetical protein
MARFAESATTLSDHRHFSNDFMLEVPASSSHSDDVMIRSLRMTVASLKQSMDRRFTRLERRMHRQFVSVDQRLNHHAQVDDEHEKRLRELEDSAPSA